MPAYYYGALSPEFNTLLVIIESDKERPSELPPYPPFHGPGVLLGIYDEHPSNEECAKLHDRTKELLTP